MKKLAIAVALISTLATHSNTNAQEDITNYNESPYEGCEDQRYFVPYHNGIWTELDDALKTLFALKDEITFAAPLYNLDVNCIHIDLIYNPTGLSSLGRGDGHMYDAFQAYKQARIQNHYDDFFHWMGEGFPGLLIPLIDALLALSISINTQMSDLSFSADTEIDIITREYEHWINTYDAKIIPVAHSQGNFHANRADIIMEDNGYPADAIQVVAIATPAANVGRGGDQNVRRTITTSDMINYVPGGLSPTNENTEYCSEEPSVFSLNSIRCHEVMRTYLREPQTKKSILDDVFTLMKPNSANPERATNLVGWKIDDIIERYGELFIEAKSPSGNDGLYSLSSSESPELLFNTNENGDDQITKIDAVGSNMFLIAKNNDNRDQLWHAHESAVEASGFTVKQASLSSNPQRTLYEAFHYDVFGNTLVVQGYETATDRSNGYRQLFISTNIGHTRSIGLEKVRTRNGGSLTEIHGVVQVGDYIYFRAIDQSRDAELAIWRTPVESEGTRTATKLSYGPYEYTLDNSTSRIVKFQGEPCFTAKTDRRYVILCVDSKFKTYQKDYLVNITDYNQAKILSADSTKIHVAYSRKEPNAIPSWGPQHYLIYDSESDKVIIYPEDTNQWRFHYHTITNKGEAYVYTHNRMTDERSVYSYSETGSRQQIYSTPNELNIRDFLIHKKSIYFFDDRIRKINDINKIEAIEDLPNLGGVGDSISGLYSLPSGLYAVISTGGIRHNIWKIAN